MRPQLAVVLLGVALAAQAEERKTEEPKTVHLKGCREPLPGDCVACLASKPADPNGCNFDRVVLCMERLQLDVEWFEDLLSQDRESLAAKAEQQARILDLLGQIRAAVGPPAAPLSEVQELVDKLREEIAGPQSTDSGAAKTIPAEAPGWRAGLHAYLVPRLRDAEARLAVLRKSVKGDPPLTREAIQGDLRAVSDSLWEAAIAAGAVPAPVEKAEQKPPPPDAWQLPLPESGVQGCTDKGRRKLLDGAKTAYLFDAYHAYHRLKARLARLKKCPKQGDSTSTAKDCPATAPAKNALDDAESLRLQVREQLHRVLRREGLDQPIMGVLAGGVGFSRAPDKAGQSAEQSTQSLVVRFESKHLPLGPAFDAGLLGKFGVQSSFDMVKPDDPGKFSRNVTIVQTGPEEFSRVTTEESVVRLVCPAADSPDEDCKPASPPSFGAQYANSFVWDVGLRAGPAWSRAEASGFARGGQTHPLPEFTAVKNDAGDPVAATLLGKGADRRWYYEWGGRLVVYRQRSNREAHEIGALTPVLEAEAGWRIDQRFKDRADDFPPERFGDHPERRWFLRFALNGLPVIGGADTPFLMSFAVEWEGKRGGKGLPSGTKIYVQGNLDLNKLLAAK